MFSIAIFPFGNCGGTQQKVWSPPALRLGQFCLPSRSLTPEDTGGCLAHTQTSQPHKAQACHRAFALTLPSTWVTVTPDSSLLISYSSVSSKYHLSVRPSPFTNTPQPSSMLYCSPWHRSSSNILYILYICFLNCPSFPQQNYRPHERSSLLSLCTQGRRQAVPKHCPHFLRETGGSHHRVLVNLEIWERKTTEHSKSFSLNQIQWGHLPNPDSLKEATRAPEDITF